MPARQSHFRRLLSFCTDQDLIQLLSRSAGKGNGESSIPSWTYGFMRLSSMNLPQLACTLQLSDLEAYRLAAVFEVHRRLCALKAPTRHVIASPEVLADLLRPWLLEDRERLWCIALTTRMHVIGDPIEISAGDVDGTEASVRAFFRAALRTGAAATIAVHNHPSGELTPSAEDRAITRHLVAAGRLIDVRLTDHVIFAPGGECLSLRRQSPDLFQ